MTRKLTCLLWLLAAGAWAQEQDQGYLVNSVKGLADGLRFTVTDLAEGPGDRTSTEEIRDTELVADLSTGEWGSASRVHAGDILFKVQRGTVRQYSFITPGKKVHPGVAARDPEYARQIDALSQSVGSGLQRNSRKTSAQDDEATAFVFILELGLNAPLTLAQERVIEDALRELWAKVPVEKRLGYAAFSSMAVQVMQANARKWEGYRRELEETARQWMKEAGPDNAVAGKLKALTAEGARPTKGSTPPLTEGAATAFAELRAFSDLLALNEEATPAQLTPASVEETRQQLLSTWGRLSPAERKAVQRAPGLWAATRAVLRHGTVEQRQRVGALLQGPPRTSGVSTRLVSAEALTRLEKHLRDTHPWSRRFLP